ncbi:MAG: hypothetical protein U1E77_03600 [Inhella sp.]
MRFILTSATMVLALTAPAAQARSEAMWQPERVMVAERAGLDAKAMRVVLIKAGSRRNWMVQSDQPGELQLKQSRGGKHEATVKITYDARGYQLIYADSYNLNVDAERSHIHPTYNMWLRNLNGDIQAELALYNLGAP